MSIPRIVVLLVFLLIGGCTPSSSNKPSELNINRDTVHQIQSITLNDELVSTGSAVMINPNLALTAAHTFFMEGETLLHPLYLIVKGDRLEVRVLHWDSEKDLALLWVDYGCPCSSLAGSLPQPDETVEIIGFPYNLGKPALQVRTRGTYQGLDNEYDFAITTAQVSPGNSGGGVFNSRGELVGIAVAMVWSSNYLSASVPITTIKELLKQWNSIEN